MISKYISHAIEKSSWIRKMFEAGNELKKIHGAENVFDLSLGNPILEPPDQFFDLLKKLSAEKESGKHRYMSNAGFIDVREKIVSYLNGLLNISEFEDYCVNGMQVEGKRNVKKIVLGVSVSQRLFQQAIKKKADMIIVHHGIFWKSDPHPFYLTGIFRKRLALLIKNDINLLAYHLPLDAHPEIGNNAQIMKLLNIEPTKRVDVGLLGRLKSKIELQISLSISNLT